MDNQISSQPDYSLKQLVSYFFRLGYSGFGGPVALVDYMRRDLVEKYKWISEEEYKEGLALAQLAPGPLAAQLGHLSRFCALWCIGCNTCRACLCFAFLHHGCIAGDRL